MSKQPKRAKPRQIIELFARNISNPVPEVLLMFGVIKQAILDTRDQEPIYRRDAINFFVSGRHHLFCDLVGLDGEWVREVLRDHGVIGY